MIMKKLLALITVLALVATMLAGCGSTTPPAVEDGGEEAAPLKFAYLARGLESQWPMDVADSYKKLAAERGFEITICDAELSAEKQLQQVDEMISAGVDAIFLLIVDEGAAQSIADRCAEAGVLLIGESIPLMDSEGNWVAPQVMLDAYNCGYDCATWLAENVADYGIDLTDLSKVGFFTCADSRLTNDMNRSDGAVAGLKAALPGFPEENIFLADVAADAASDALQAVYNQSSALIAAHPEIEYWLTVPVMEEDAVGACRAMEDNGVIEKGAIASIGGERAVLAWPDGQSAPWLACSYFHGMHAAERIVDAAFKVLKDGVPADEVFTPEAGQAYGFTTFSGIMCTYDNYTDYLVTLG